MRLDPIIINPYDSKWPTMFEDEQKPLEHALASVLTAPVEHIGSTAVPGCPAKPIIDMLAVVSDIDRVDCEGLAQAGWLLAPEPGDAGDRRLSFCRPSKERRTHHLHVVEAQSSEWKDWIIFRDYLRARPEVVTSYAELKRALASEHGGDPNDRSAYRSGKTTFVNEVVRAAKGTPAPGSTD